MDILNEALEFVNKQIAFHKTKAEEFAPSNASVSVVMIALPRSTFALP